MFPAHIIEELLEIEVHGSKGIFLPIAGYQGNDLLVAVQFVVIAVEAIDDCLQCRIDPVVVELTDENDDVCIEQLRHHFVFDHVIRFDLDFCTRLVILKLDQ